MSRLSLSIGLLLGVFFPVGLDRVRAQGRDFVPWAWGINGSASVYGSIVNIFVAMFRGFHFTLGLGMAAYRGDRFGDSPSAEIEEACTI